MSDLSSVDAVVTATQMDRELIIQAGVGHMTPEMAARATLALNGPEIERLIEKMKEDAYRSGYAARQAELDREEAAREREFVTHARLITRICSIDRD